MKRDPNELRREYYNRTWESKSGLCLRPMKVPEEVERVEETEPCFMCGTARGPCRHRGRL